MIAATLLIGRATSPVDGIIQGWRNLENVKDSFSRIESLLQKFDLPKGQHKNLISGKLNIENLSYKVEKRKLPILDQINLELPAGLVYGVIGPSGAGKSSLGRAILGILPGVTGKVHLDDILIDEYDREILGAQFGYLPQSIELFSGSVAQNIARMNEIDSEKVINAATIAGVHDLVLHFERGYDTQIGVLGGHLSGGQRQRIALARAIYGMPKLIVLDEPNANLDDVGNLALVNAIQSIKNAGSSVFLITHRPDILKVTDRVIYMNEGRVKLYETNDSFLERIKNQSN
jgi:ABC-type protease/lipase transport system fused ATPase/permease subunit